MRLLPPKVFSGRQKHTDASEGVTSSLIAINIKKQKQKINNNKKQQRNWKKGVSYSRDPAKLSIHGNADVTYTTRMA